MPSKIMATRLFKLLLVGMIMTITTNAASILPESENMDLPIQTDTPVIGVLTEVLRDYMRFSSERQLFIASSYIKWIEAAGAQALPILLNQDDSYYERVFNQTNGLLLPGGDNILNPARNTPMLSAARKLYKLALEANDRGDIYPIWGTCLGMELLSVLSSEENVLEECSAIDVVLPLEISERGKLFAPSSYLDLCPMDDTKHIVDALSTNNLTYNFHHKCLTDNGLKEAGLKDFYRPIAYSEDVKGFKFIAALEAINYPFYGVQFHPEKPPFEFLIQRHQKNIPHSRKAVAVSRYFADFFISIAQRSSHKGGEGIQDSLIYLHTPLYTAPVNDLYEQRYLFPYEGCSSSSSGECSIDEGEFMDYLPDDDEEAPE